MALVIESGISIGPGITIQSGPEPSVLMLSLDAANYSGSGPWIDTVSGLQFTLYNSPVYSSSIGGGTFEFDPGSQQHANSPASLPMDLPHWSVIAWHYYTGTNSGSSPCIITEVYPGITGQINYALGSLNDNNPTLMAGWYSGGWNMTGYTLTPGNWYQIAGTYDGTSVKLYVNNVQVGGLAATGNAISSQGGINLMQRWDNTEYWGGYLSIVKVYKGDIGAGGIDADWNANGARFGLLTPPLLLLNAGNSSSYPGTGTTWTNIGSAGSADNATLNNAPPFTSFGSLGYFTFDGGPQCGQVPLPVTTDMTWGIWFNTITTDGSISNPWYADQMLIGGELGGDTTDMGIAMAEGHIVFGMGDPDTTMVSNNTYNNGAWHYLVVTRNSTTGVANIYVDGALDKTQSSYPVTARTTDPLGIAFNYASESNFWPGSISQIQAWDRVLSATQITSYYNTQKSAYGHSDSFTINPGDITFVNLQYGGYTDESSSGFTSTGTQLYNGIQYSISPALRTSIYNAWQNSGMTTNISYVWQVSWTTGGTGLIRVSFEPTGADTLIMAPIDQTDTRWQSGDTIGPTQTGTFTFPATFTTYTPITALKYTNDWC